MLKINLLLFCIISIANASLNLLDDILDKEYMALVGTDAQKVVIEHNKNTTPTNRLTIEKSYIIFDRKHQIDISLGTNHFTQTGINLKTNAISYQIALEHFLSANSSLRAKINYSTQRHIRMTEFLLGLNYYLPKLSHSSTFYLGASLGKGTLSHKKEINNSKPTVSSTIFDIHTGMIFDFSNKKYLRFEVSYKDTDYNSIVNNSNILSIKSIISAFLGLGFKF